jgi:hypothetical protein
MGDVLMKVFVVTYYPDAELDGGDGYIEFKGVFSSRELAGKKIAEFVAESSLWEDDEDTIEAYTECFQIQEADLDEWVDVQV